VNVNLGSGLTTVCVTVVVVVAVATPFCGGTVVVRTVVVLAVTGTCTMLVMKATGRNVAVLKITEGSVILAVVIAVRVCVEVTR
jgi:hypothetical protein